MSLSKAFSEWLVVGVTTSTVNFTYGLLNWLTRETGWLNCAAVHTSDGLPDSDKDTPFTVRDPVFGNSRVLNRAPNVRS